LLKARKWKDVDLDEAKKKLTKKEYDALLKKWGKTTMNKLPHDVWMQIVANTSKDWFLGSVTSKGPPRPKYKGEEVDFDEAKQPEYEVKYAKSKRGPIKVTKFMTLDQAKEFLAKVKKDGMNGIISKGGKPVKEETILDRIDRKLKEKKNE